MKKRYEIQVVSQFELDEFRKECRKELKKHMKKVAKVLRQQKKEPIIIAGEDLSIESD